MEVKKSQTPTKPLPRRRSPHPKKRASYTRVKSERQSLQEKAPISHLEKVETFLQDALHYRDTRYQHEAKSMFFYRTRFSPIWRTLSYCAAWIALLGSFFPSVELYTDCLWLWVFSVDFYFKAQYREWNALLHSPKNQLFLVMFGMMGVDLITRTWTGSAWSAVLRPASLVYIDVACYNTFVQTILLFPSVAPMLAMELFLILIFTCLCVVLYGYYDDTTIDFSNAPIVFVQLFQLQTTVNDPDVWLPLYKKNPWNALLFISFLITNLFFMHNIVLAVVYEAFAERKKVRTKQRAENRRRALKLAFDLLDPNKTGQVKKAPMVKLLSHLRPHYSQEKIEVLYSQIDQEGNESIGIDQFQKIPLAMTMRVHALRDDRLILGPFWKAIEQTFNLANVAFVLFACANHPMKFFFSVPFWIVNMALAIFFFISVAIDFVKVGFRPYFRSFWKMVNLCAVFCSLISLGVLVTGNLFEGGTFWVYDPYDNWNRMCLIFAMFSRCLDMTRILSSIVYFRDVMKTVMESLPSIYALSLVIFSFFHIFCYFGVLVWGGRVDTETQFNGNPPFYYLNNFNSYREGIVTLFELLVVNNWNIISSGYFNLEGGNLFVYFFFIFFNIMVVTVLMNLFTSFFISAFLMHQKDHGIKDTDSLEGFGRFWRLSSPSLKSQSSSEYGLDLVRDHKLRTYSMPPMASPRKFSENEGFIDMECASFEGNILSVSHLTHSRRSKGSVGTSKSSNPNFFCSSRIMSDDELFQRRVEEVSSTVIVQALSHVLNEGIRVTKGAEIVFENENFSKMVSKYGKKGKILRNFGSAIKDFEPQEEDTFPRVLAENIWNHPQDVRSQLRIVCCIAQIDPQIIMYVSNELFR